MVSILYRSASVHGPLHQWSCSRKPFASAVNLLGEGRALTNSLLAKNAIYPLYLIMTSCCVKKLSGLVHKLEENVAGCISMLDYFRIEKTAYKIVLEERLCRLESTSIALHDKRLGLGPGVRIPAILNEIEADQLVCDELGDLIENLRQGVDLHTMVIDQLEAFLRNCRSKMHTLQHLYCPGTASWISHDHWLVKLGWGDIESEWKFHGDWRDGYEPYTESYENEMSDLLGEGRK